VGHLDRSVDKKVLRNWQDRVQGPGTPGSSSTIGRDRVNIRRLVRRRTERGAAAVEFALVLPVLILIIGAIIDFGFIFAQQISYNTAARDAARAGVLPSVTGAKLTCAQVASRARVGASSGAVGAAPLTIAVTVTGAGGTCSLPAGSSTASGASSSFPCTGSSGPSATVSDLAVQLTYASSPPFPVPFMGSVNLGSKGNFQCEYTA
jgi:Flp pilus assembly protein TadG